MSAKSRSIGQRLNKAKDPGLRAQIADDWARNWMQDQTDVLHLLERAQRAQDWNGIAAAIAQLRAVTEKRFTAFPGVIAKLTEANQASDSASGDARESR